MGRKRIEKNPLDFKKGYFLSLAQQKLTPCEFRCLLVLVVEEESTKEQLAIILVDMPQHGMLMIHLEKLSLVKHIRTEDRNSFFKLNLDFNFKSESLDIDLNQLTI